MLADPLKTSSPTTPNFWCMTRELITVDVGTPIYEVAEMLALHRIGALPVMRGGELAGIVSVTDFLQYVAAQTRPETITN